MHNPLVCDNPKEMLVEALMALGVSSGWDDAFQRVLDLYLETSRGHHNLRHVTECMLWVRQLRLLLHKPHHAMIAFFYHDAVYRPGSSNNEEQSAILARADLQDMRCANADVSLIEEMIVGRNMGRIANTPDDQFVHDIDYWVLGSDPRRYKEYAAGIMKENLPRYSVEEYKAGRGSFLNGVLKQPRIFETDYFYERFEEQARANVHLELSEFLPSL